MKKPPENAIVTFPGSVFFLPAPFFMDIILNIDSNNPAKIFRALIPAAKAFDLVYAADKSFKDKAADHAGDFTFWAYGGSLGKINETCFTITPNNSGLK